MARVTTREPIAVYYHFLLSRAIQSSLADEDFWLQRVMCHWADFFCGLCFGLFVCTGTVQTARDFCIYPRPTPVSSPTSGFLSSLVTELTGCGSVLTPWSVVVPPGQTIRLTLYDFAVARQHRKAGVGTTSMRGDGASPPHSCPAYAVLREPNSVTKSSRADRNVTVCGGVARRSVVYVSVGNKVDVGLERADHVVYGAHYLIEYQGTRLTHYL